MSLATRSAADNTVHEALLDVKKQDTRKNQRISPGEIEAGGATGMKQRWRREKLHSNIIQTTIAEEEEWDAHK